MSFDYKHLDERTRGLMLKEIDRDIAAGTLYPSHSLSHAGCGAYPGLLREAARNRTEVTLARS